VETSAPGKVILLGEHAVVYGHRAIAAAVSLTTTVTLTRRPGPSRVEQSSIQDPRLAQALATVVPAEGIGVAIRSTLPAGCGMGSSAALAVAVVRALARLEGREASLRELVERGFELERVFHGNPSGLDHTVSASGGALLFRREAPAEELRVARPLRLVIANTGTPSNTAEMVEGVRRRNPTGLVMRLGALAEMAAVCISRGEPIGHFLREAHRCLRLMGVSTPQLDDLCRAMESAGAAGAKLSGAGGGGIALALVDERTEEPVRRAVEPLARGGVFVAEIAATPGRR
jgi:mevalonate kinase